jgi:hypothetical protein
MWKKEAFRLRRGSCANLRPRGGLWKLPYWSKLKLRHNLDVMHIEKNICEYLIVTILNIAGKTRIQLKPGYI